MSDSVPVDSYVGALDQGTTSTRFILFSVRGDALCHHQLEHETFSLHNGWAEQDPLEILERAKTCIDACMRKAGELHGVSKGQVKAIGITNQRETTVLWDRESGQPLCRAIVWHDIRTMETVEMLKKKVKGSLVKKITGLPISSYFSGVKLRWMMDNIKGARAAVEDGSAMFGTIDSWLLWKLTGGSAHVTDVTNAGRTMMMNIKTGEWDPKMLDVLGVNPAVLPEIKSCSEVYGVLRGTVLTGVPIAGLIGDQQSALVGQSCFSKGQAKNTYGTGCFLIVNTGVDVKFSTHGLLTTPAYKLGPKEPTVYSLEGSVANGGECVKWLRDKVHLIEDAAQSESVAAEVADTGDVYVVPAFSGLFAPHWDETARGTVVGMTLSTRKAHLVRATLEGISFMVNDALLSAQADMGAPLTELRVDGGASVNDLLMQIQADIAGVKVVRPKVVETTALGAAFCAGHAVGFFQSIEAFTASWKEDKAFIPDHDEIRSTRLSRWNAAVERSKGWIGDGEESKKWVLSKDIALTAVISSCIATLLTTFVCKIAQKRN